MSKSTPKLLAFVIVVLCFSVVNIFAQKSKTKTKTSAKTPNTPIKTANTAKVSPIPQKISTMSLIEQEILDEINLLRSNPQTYIKLLEEMKNEIDKNVVILPNGTRWQMSEGVTAINDAINSLKTTGKLKPYAFSSGMTKAANMQLADLQENMSLGHRGKDGGDVENRLIKFGMPGERYSENISYYVKDVRSAVLIMVIDDAFKSRNHRKNLLSTQFNQIGTAYGRGKNDVGICIVVFADTFTEINK